MRVGIIKMNLDRAPEMKIDINGNGGEFTVGGVDEKQIDFIYDKLKNSEETGDGRKHIDDTVFETDEILCLE